MRKAYLIANIEEYGKLMAHCIENDICVFRTFWDAREQGNRCYIVDYPNKKCFYSSRKYCEDIGYEIVIPNFAVDKWGRWVIADTPTEKGR